MTNDRPSSSQGSEGDARFGLLCGIVAYTLWGLFPLFFKQVDHVAALEIVTWRILWAIPVCALIIFLRRQWGEIKTIFTDWRIIRVLFVSAIFIAVNWFGYVFAVANGRVLEASLAYYINPLMFIAAGVLVLGESLSRFQAIAVALATIGVLVLTIALGEAPWMALVMAFSFTVYGYLRKTTPVGAVPGLFTETVLLAPVAMGVLVFLALQSRLSFGAIDAQTDLLLILSGPLTTAPLTLFALAARRLTLTVLGFIQYIGPTGQLFLGLYYGEAFTWAHGVCFGLIWLALGFASYDMLQRSRVEKKRAQTAGPSGSVIEKSMAQTASGSPKNSST